MQKVKIFDTKTITGLGLLTALVIIFQLLANYVQLGPVSITLSLIPIAVGSIFYGPLAGAFLGFIDGAIILFAPSTISVFFAISPVGAVVTCLVKTTLAGFVSGHLVRIIEKRNKKLGVIMAGISVPLINTGSFVGFAFLFFRDWLEAGSINSAYSPILFLILVAIGWNFLLEFAISAVLSPMVYNIYAHFFKKKQIVEEGGNKDA